MDKFAVNLQKQDSKIQQPSSIETIREKTRETSSQVKAMLSSIGTNDILSLRCRFRSDFLYL